MPGTRVRFRGVPMRRPTPSQPLSITDFSTKIAEILRLHAQLMGHIDTVKKMHATFHTVKQGAPGKRGERGDQGIRGPAGKDTVTRADVEDAVQKYMIQPKDATAPAPETIAEAILQSPKFERLLKKHLRPGRDGQAPQTDALVAMVIEQLRGKKLSLSDIEGLDTKFSELRGHINASKEWRGGGDTVVAGPNVTIENTANGNKRISASGGIGYQVPTSGVVNGINQIFTFTMAPNVIVVDQGRPMQKVSSDGTVNWTGTTTVTLAIAPEFDIFATA